MKIGICDDNRVSRKVLRARIARGDYIEEYELQEFSSALEIIEQRPQLDLLFLDIEMPEMTGKELLLKYPYLFKNMKVVFFSSYTEYLKEGYELGLYRYLMKPVDENKLRELFDSITYKGVMDRKLELKSRGTRRRVALKDIFYIEVRKNFSTVVTVSGRWECYKSLREFEQQLPEQYFYRTHKSFIVNMNQIETISHNTSSVIMKNGEEVAVTIRNKKKFEEIYEQFIMNK